MRQLRATARFRLVASDCWAIRAQSSALRALHLVVYRFQFTSATFPKICCGAVLSLKVSNSLYRKSNLSQVSHSMILGGTRDHAAFDTSLVNKSCSGLLCGHCEIHVPNETLQVCKQTRKYVSNTRFPGQNLHQLTSIPCATKQLAVNWCGPQIKPGRVVFVNLM